MKFFGMTFQTVFKRQDIFTDDLRKSAATKNPTISADIDLVYVLSGRTTALGADADGLKREFDPEDDLARLLEGVRIATQINALRANKKPEELTRKDYVTPIFYNGRAIHNQHLRAALKRKLLPYPKELFIIADINPENTIGQIQSFSRYLSTHHHENVAVVSSAYHLARVARTLSLDSPQVNNEKALEGAIISPWEKWVENPLSKLKLFLYGVHKNEKRPGIVFDLQGEHSAMQRYSAGPTPSIARQASSNVFFTDEDVASYKSFKTALFWGTGGRTEDEEEQTKNEYALIKIS